MFFYIALGVAVLLFGFLAYLTSKVWQASHVVLVSFVFIFCMLFMVLAAMNLRTQDAWRTVHDNLTKQIAQTDAEIEALQYSNALRGDEPSLPVAKAELGRMLIDRGRIWRGAVPVDQQGTGFVLSMADWGDAQRLVAELEAPDEFADPAAADGQDGEQAADADTNPHGIVQGTILHAFIELPIPESLGPILFPAGSPLVAERAALCKLPLAYVGKYRVTEQTDAAITVEPIVPLDEAQVNAIAAGGATWALYESLPQDSHTVFQRINENGELVPIEADSLRALFPAASGPLAQQLMEESLNEFIRDQQPASDDDPPESRSVKVRFVQAHSVQVDLDEETEDDTRIYDAFGRAVLNRLKQGKPTEFAEGDVATFDYNTATRLVSELGVAEFVDEPAIYNRPLRNYDQQLRQRADAIADLTFQISEMEKKIAASERANQLAEQQIAYRQEEIQKLGQDKSQFNAEQEVISAYLVRLKQLRDSQLATLNNIYQQNVALRNSRGSASGFFQGSNAPQRSSYANR